MGESKRERPRERREGERPRETEGEQARESDGAGNCGGERELRRRKKNCARAPVAIGTAWNFPGCHIAPGNPVPGAHHFGTPMPVSSALADRSRVPGAFSLSAVPFIIAHHRRLPPLSPPALSLAITLSPPVAASPFRWRSPYRHCCLVSFAIAPRCRSPYRYRFSVPFLLAIVRSSSINLPGPFLVLHTYLSTMAKTKQTAKKSTGGDAKRKLLGTSTRLLRSHMSHSRGTSRLPRLTPDAEPHPQSVPSPQLTPDIKMGEEPTAPAVGNVPLVAASGRETESDHVSNYCSDCVHFALLMNLLVVPLVLQWE